MIDVDAIGSASKNEILDVVRRSLSCIDARLIEHGERVAYIAGMIARMDESLCADAEKLLILCLLHDIGAYKTEEIDNMVLFETDSAMNHAAYGYAFLRNASVLGEDAEAILYHHTPYEKLAPLDTPRKRNAALIFLADRIDILLSLPGPVDFGALRRLSGTVFSPVMVELFLQADAREDIAGHIRDRSYKRCIDAQLGSISLSEAEILSYLKLLVYSIDFRSPFTVTHTANTTAISVALAERFGLGDAQRQAIRLGAFLHDIGKIAIPYSILENPGKLSREQMEVMKTHVAYSEEILRGVVSDEVCEIAIRHHEKLNGTGYHRGLGAAELSRPQKIVAVADVLSALSNRRSYKEPFSRETTLSILTEKRDAGELCPAVCNMVIENYDAILSFVSQADDPVIKLYETIKNQYERLLAAALP